MDHDISHIYYLSLNVFSTHFTKIRVRKVLEIMFVQYRPVKGIDERNRKKDIEKRVLVQSHYLCKHRLL